MIGHVGRFSKVKNHRFLVELFEQYLGETKIRCFYFYVQRPESVSHSLEYMYDKNGVLNLIHVLEKIKPCYDGDAKKERAWISGKTAGFILGMRIDH